EEHLKGLSVRHTHGKAPQVVGRTEAEVEAEEQAFLASEKGKALDDKSRQARQALVREIAESFSVYRDFQGKDIDTFEIVGLTHQQGNRQITVDIKSPNGGGSLGSDWRRHAALTVYVPKCKAVVLRGCLVGLDVSGLDANLILTSADSHNRNYDGTF